MRILSMILTNFKSKRSLTFTPGGDNAAIKGMNGTGKTTINDAFNWLLTGKDTQNKTENSFGIKTKLNGETLHNLTHSVEAIVLVGEKEITLKREFKEVWTKKRGSNIKSFSGHTTNFFIDHEPMPEKQYNSEVAKMIACDFSMYSNPMFFNGKAMTEDDRRAMLIDAFGNVEDADVIAKNKELKPLADLLEEKTIEKIIAIAKGKMKAANESLKEIPARIDELQHSLDNIILSELSVEELTTDKSALESLKADHLVNVSRIKAEAGKSTIDEAIDAKTREITALRATLDIERRKSTSEKQSYVNECKSAERIALGAWTMSDARVKELQSRIKADGVELEETRAKFKAAQARAYEQKEIMTVCPTCNQHIEADKVQAAKDEDFALFNQQKADLLELINTTGKSIKARIEENNLALINALADSEKQHIVLDEVRTNLSAAVESLDSLVFVETWTAEAAELAELKKQRAGETSVDIIALYEADNTAISKIDAQLVTVDRQIAEKRQVDKNKLRKSELMANEDAAQKTFEENEKLVMLCDTFISKKMSMLTEIINSGFKIANFKLFDVQVNGGIRECCVATGKDGVAWNESMNTGQKINIGLDIIETFQKINNVEMPIFIDNAESVTAIQKLPNQVIQLIHDAELSELTL